MNNREIFIANFLIVSLVTLFAVITFSLFSNQSLSSFLINNLTDAVIQKEVPKTEITRCSKKDPLIINTSNDPHLLKLQEYQMICGSFITDRWMIFTDFPHDEASARLRVEELSAKLKLFYENKITPIVIAEPYIGEGEMEYRDFINGKYDKALDTYFRLFKESGMTAEMMGIWVPFPESNTPNWANKDTKPEDFAIVVNKYLGVYKRYFPEGHGSILLSAISYEPDDLLWENGDYLNLVPYLININRDLIDSLGIQGLPWISTAYQTPVKQIFKADEFLQPDIAISAAQELRTRDIWFNTGTFNAKYTDDPEGRIFVSLNQRKGMLDGIIDVAKYIKGYQLNEYRVSINLFSEDKSETLEATDWSYFQNKESQDILKEFIWKAEESGINVSIFDK